MVTLIMVTLQNILEKRDEIVLIAKKLGFNQLMIFNEPGTTRLNFLVNIDSQHPEASYLNNAPLAAYLTEHLNCEVLVTVVTHLSPGIKDEVLRQSRLIMDNINAILSSFGENKVFFPNTDEMNDTEIEISKEVHKSNLDLAKEMITRYEQRLAQQKEELLTVKHELSTRYARWDEPTREEFTNWFNYFSKQRSNEPARSSRSLERSPVHNQKHLTCL